MLQIVFNEISAAEITRLGTLEQLELLDAFKVTEADLAELDGERFGKMVRDGKDGWLVESRRFENWFEGGTPATNPVLDDDA